MALEETEVVSVDRGGERQVVSMSENISPDGGRKDEAERSSKEVAKSRGIRELRASMGVSETTGASTEHLGEVRTKDTYVSGVGETV